MAIHIRIWSGSCTARITDMVNAGKRGKRCRILRFAGVPWGPGCGDTLQQKASDFTTGIIDGLQRLPLTTDFDRACAMVLATIKRAREAGVPPEYVEAYDEEIRGVDAPVEILTHVVEGIFGVTADEDGVSLSAHNDPCNEWREITSSSQSKRQAYQLAVKVWAKIKECRTLNQASDVLRTAGCRLHDYCAMD